MDKETETLLQGAATVDAERHNRKIQELPIWKKSLLTVVEAAKYFQIGESNIRRLTREHKDKDFVLWKDSRVYIRRKEMESFLDTINEI
ncbi:MAG: excisionase [Monoglobaceae bacterium]